ncbi:MAG TPA: lasso peptide biosynthesis B2 protein [Candidatus Nanoperiomorbaceae bacterium]|nr:lasso peptide biosynthesis B2 protein [Candidatus Nanoperiomorbaceae bacterium]
MTLPWRGKWLYCNTALWLIAVKAGLCLLPFDRLLGWITAADKPTGQPVAMKDLREITEAIERLGRFLALLQINCLPQALVGQKLLRHKGFDVQLKIGVLKNRGDRLSAHAWIEYQGQVILGDLRGLGQFTVFPMSGSALPVERFTENKLIGLR